MGRSQLVTRVSVSSSDGTLLCHNQFVDVHNLKFKTMSQAVSAILRCVQTGNLAIGHTFKEESQELKQNLADIKVDMKPMNPEVHKIDDDLFTKQCFYNTQGQHHVRAGYLQVACDGLAISMDLPVATYSFCNASDLRVTLHSICLPEHSRGDMNHCLHWQSVLMRGNTTLSNPHTALRTHVSLPSFVCIAKNASHFDVRKFTKNHHSYTLKSLGLSPDTDAPKLHINRHSIAQISSVDADAFPNCKFATIYLKL